MVGTIIPIGYGERLGGRRLTCLWLFVGGAIVGGAAFGSLLSVGGAHLGLGPLGASIPGRGLAILVCCHIAVVGREIGVLRFPLPQSRWQVPREWLASMPVRMAATLYGLALGTGVLTRVTTGGFYLLLLWALMSGSRLEGALMFAAFGLGRGVPVLALASVTDNTDDLGSSVTALDPWWAAMRLVNALVISACGGWFFAMAVVRLEM